MLQFFYYSTEAYFGFRAFLLAAVVTLNVSSEEIPVSNLGGDATRETNATRARHWDGSRVACKKS
jgi:hypothetical protein